MVEEDFMLQDGERRVFFREGLTGVKVELDVRVFFAFGRVIMGSSFHAISLISHVSD